MKTLEQFQRGIPHRLIPTNVPGAYASPPFPHGFDPHTASGTALKRHGIPWKRPSGTDHPRLLSAWNSAFSRPWTPENHIVPQLQVQQGKARRSTLSGTVTTDMLHNAWTGVVCQDPFNLNANPNITITGQWVIPTVTKPANGRPAGPVPILNTNDSGWDSSTWIGIDGFFSSDLTLSTDVLQAGVQHYVKLSGEAVYVAWYEWYVPTHVPGEPGYVNPTNIVNFLVRPGDAVYCNVSYVNHQYGSISFGNVTTGQWFSITLQPPVNASFNGKSIEWILEAPSGGWPQGAVVPDFTEVTFTNALGCGGGVDPVDPLSGLGAAQK